MGTGFAMASVIWEIDSWSLAKQSGIYFSIACVTMLPIAYITNWMKHNAIGILSYVGIFVAIFVITWLVQYFVWKRKVKRMNDGVRKSNNANEHNLHNGNFQFVKSAAQTLRRKKQRIAF